MENLYKHYKYTLLGASSLHKLSKMIVFQLQSVHKQHEELSLIYECSQTVLKNNFGSISVWILSSPPLEITPPYIDLSMFVWIFF